MIYITEKRAEKLSGLTSIFVSFNYNQQLINLLKSNFPIYNYNTKTHAWELPINRLAELLDLLTYIDDIKLKLYSEEQRVSNDPKLVENYKLKPFAYQEEGIKYGLTHDKWLLLDGMGLGKTAQMIGLARELKAQRGLQHCLIICGLNTLKTNWKKEITKHSDESVRILGEKVNSKGNITYTSIPERANELLNPIDDFFIITNIETFRDDKVVEAFKNSKNAIDMIVVDEVHRCKSKVSQQGKNLLKLKAKYKVALTGTLLLNNPLDCYVPLVWTENDHSTLTNFKNQYCTFGGFGGHEVVGFHDLDILKDELDNCSLRRTKDLLDLPPKNIIYEYIDMEDSHKKFYDAIKKGVKEEADKIELKASNLLALVTRLRQASVCPSILTTQQIQSSKIKRCVELTEDILSNNDKVVIMSTFKESAYEVAKLLQKYNPLVCTGDSSEAYINNAVDEFQNNPDRKIMIATWQKMGTGITLTAARYMIHLDTAWTYALFDQTNDRIYRIGQDKPVFIYSLVCHDTIDERVKDILETKKSMADFILDDKVDDQSMAILKEYIQDL